jgi:hypothetical protein
MPTLPHDLSPATRSLLTAGAFVPPLGDEAFVARVMAAIAREAERLQARLATFHWAALVGVVLLVGANAHTLLAQASFPLAHLALAFAQAGPVAPLLGIVALAGGAWVLTERA